MVNFSLINLGYCKIYYLHHLWEIQHFLPCVLQKQAQPTCSREGCKSRIYNQVFEEDCNKATLCCACNISSDHSTTKKKKKKLLI